MHLFVIEKLFMLCVRVSLTPKGLLSGVLHHVSWGREHLDGGALRDLLLSTQLLDGVYDLLGVFHANLHRVAEILLQHVLRRCLNHH